MRKYQKKIFACILSTVLLCQSAVCVSVYAAPPVMMVAAVVAAVAEAEVVVPPVTRVQLQRLSPLTVLIPEHLMILPRLTKMHC